MKSSFQGYYSPDADDLKILWSEALFVLDTNVLLHLYRVPEATRAQMLFVLHALKGRIWVPRHVGIEYQRRRLEAIHTAHQKTDAVLKELDRALEGYESAVRKAELEERGVRDANEPLAHIRAQAKKVRGTVEATLAGQLSPTEHDVIRDEVDALFEGRVGRAPESQATVDGWDNQGRERFAMKRGPGFEDATKAEGEDPSFYAQGLVYQRQFGDLYIWLQLLEHVRSEEVKNVVFVTQDGKEDWWRIAPGHGRNRARLAPLESLAEEVRAAGADRFWMYQLDTFLREAERQLKVKVSDLTIKDARQVETSVEVKPEIEATIRPKVFGARELHQVVKLVSDEKIFDGDRIAAGYKRLADGQYTAEIVLLPGLALEGPALRKALAKVCGLLALLAVKTVNVHMLTKGSGRPTEIQSLAIGLIQEELVDLLPADTTFSLQIVRFTDEDLTKIQSVMVSRSS